jgi:hypothetical protein
VTSVEAPPDPVRATLVAVLQQLNRAESINEGKVQEQTLELDEMERLLSRFWAVEQGHVKVPLALGLLVRNGLVEARLPTGRTPGGPPTRAIYQITAEGKAFLVDVQKSSERIP